MRRAKGWTAVVGVAAALIAGFAGSAAAVRLSDYPGAPGERAAVAAATTAIGQPPADRPGPVIVCDYWCPEYDGDGVVSYDAPADRTDVVTVTYDLPRTRAGDVERAARQRLAAAGWRDTGDDRYARDGLTVDLQITDEAGGTRATIVAAKAFSVPALTAALAGLLAGAVLGGLVAAAAVRRHRRHGPVLRAVTATVTSLVVATTLTYALHVGMLAFHLSAQGAWKARDVQLAEFVLTVLPSVSVAVATAVLAVLALLALPVRRPALP